MWEVTARCPLSCAHCYNVWTIEGAPTPHERSPVQRLALVDRLLPLRRRLRTLTLSGGEPLLLDVLESLVRRIAERKPRVQINLSTSGLLLEERRAHDLARAGVRLVQLTLLSARPETHDRMVGRPGTHEKVLAAMHLARQAGLAVAVYFVATRDNIDEWPGAARLALALGADVLVFNRFQPGGRALSCWRELTPTVVQLQRAMEQVTQLRRMAPVQLGTPLPCCEVGPGRRQDTLRCPIGTANAYPTIGPDGTLRPCNHWPASGGSLLARPLTQVLRHPYFGRPRAGSSGALLAALPAECASCKLARGCGGGCPAARCLANDVIYGRTGSCDDAGFNSADSRY